MLHYVTAYFRLLMQQDRGLVQSLNVVLLVKVTSKFSAKTFCNLQLCDFCRLANYPTDHVTLSSLMYFRLLPNFAGVLWEKIRTRTSFTIILSNCISEESLITAVYDKKYNSIVDFNLTQRKCQEPVRRETTEGSCTKFIGGDRKPQHEQNGCTVLFTRHQSTNM